MPDIESRIRTALGSAAPDGLPSIGVREKVVEAINRRRQRRLRVAGGVAACCVVVGAVTAGIVSAHSGSSSPSAGGARAFASSAPSTPHGAASNSPTGAPAICPQVSVGNNSGSGCYGTFSSVGNAGGTSANRYSSTQDNQNKQSLSVATTTTTAPQPEGSNGVATGTNAAPTSARASTSTGGTAVVVPLNTMIRLTIPGSAGEIWTAPAVGPGQGSGAGKVETVESVSGGNGRSSYAIFRSSVPVTVRVRATEIPACGSQSSPCGTPTTLWSVVLEFKAS